jgi:hypothetical protein
MQAGELAMPRISTKRDKQRRPYSASAENTTRREIRVPSPLEEVKLDVLRLLLGFTDLDCGTATFVPLTHTIAGLTANPLDLIHAALVELIEDGDLTYRFDGSMRCFRTFAPVLGSVEARDEHRAGHLRCVRCPMRDCKRRCDQIPLLQLHRTLSFAPFR